MTRFAVDPAVLCRTATSVRNAAEEAEAVSGERNALARRAAALADAELVAALEQFADRWRYGLDSLIGDARRVADGLDLAAAVYRDVEVVTEVSFRGSA